MGEYKASSWREQRVTIQPETHETIYFNDTQPNHILIANSSPNPIFIGISAISDATTYDMIIPGYGTKLYPRMQGTTRIYVYSESVEPVILNITSWEGEFDPASIPQAQEMVTGSADGLLGIVDINNFMQSLPPGDNYLGQVGIDGPLPAGENHLGMVTIKGGGQDYTAALELLLGYTGRMANRDYTRFLETFENLFNSWYDDWLGGDGSGGGGSGGGSGGSGGYAPLTLVFMGDTVNDQPIEWKNNPMDQNDPIQKSKDFTLILSCEDTRAGKIKIDIQTPGYKTYAMDDYFTIGSYIWDKPAGVSSIHLTEKDFPALGNNYFGIKILATGQGTTLNGLYGTLFGGGR